MKKFFIVLICMTFIVNLFVSIEKHPTYFTSYTKARGGFPIKLSDDSKIQETLKGWNKILTVTNRQKHQAVYVRARAFSGVTHPVSYEGENWFEGEDGYWYFGKGKSQILNSGKTTTPLTVSVTPPQNENGGDSFQVIVVYETVPVLYDKEGIPIEDWTQKRTVKENAYDKETN